MKKIEDYLHLYLGCEMKNTYGQMHKLTFDNYETLLVWGKPILRPLSDMSEDEEREMRRVHFEADNKLLPWFYDTYFECVRYLLKQGFDLFGLIESGLAIDKTKLN